MAARSVFLMKVLLVLIFVCCCSLLLVFCGVRLLAATTLIELLERFYGFVGTGNKLLALARNPNASRWLGSRTVTVAYSTVDVISISSHAIQWTSMIVVVLVSLSLRVGGPFLWHWLTPCIRQRFWILKFSLTDSGVYGLCLHESQEILLGGIGWTADAWRWLCCRCCCRGTSILHDEVRGELMATHTTHGSQLRLLSWLLTSWNILVHDVCKIDPLVPVSVSILGWIWLRTWNLANIHALRMISGPHEHGWLAMPGAWRLAAKSTCI